MWMTYRQALLIQEAQLMYYRQSIGRKGVKEIRRRTKPCPGNPDQPVFVGDINGLVPRGGTFEGLIKRYPINRDPNAHAWHNASRAGKLYH